ncbi:SDR family oxidoreductase [Rhodopila sp.]|uniref:SDR family oxidoreductase n=1 Tax=Rhodopila sp. TaxID=2480087 RepID=UPI003D12FF14
MSIRIVISLLPETGLQSLDAEGKAGEWLPTLIPYRRIGEMDDVGRAAAWLASNGADHVVATIPFVDGGMMSYPDFRADG